MIIQKNKNISHYLTLRNNVIAELFFEAKSREDLIAAKKYSLDNRLDIFILGGGSNLAVLKSRMDGLVVKNSYVDLKVIDGNEKEVKMSVSSGFPISLLIARSIQNGWSGFEYHQGLPGTVGGAVYMNSKWTKPLTYFGDNLVYAFLIDSKGREKKVGKSYFEFDYDHSILQKTKEILLEGVFILKKDSKEEIMKRAKFAFDYRRKTQPYGIASSGCFFKNYQGRSAGYMIDKAGLKGFSVGNYFVSPIHANFIINKGEGKREDLIELIHIIKNKVRDKFGVTLEEEVIII
ncbi:UDP-N-acetylmuramate dehydrogenase [Patescibacteria group bacterium]|nr:UDP-N-acetylmuramate dehydrogenase [Patescibacteria group bacterium]